MKTRTAQHYLFSLDKKNKIELNQKATKRPCAVVPSCAGNSPLLQSYACQYQGKHGTHTTHTNSIFDNNLIDRKQLAEKLGVSLAFISKLRALEGLPYIKIGRAVRYDLREVMVFLNQRKYP